MLNIQLVDFAETTLRAEVASNQSQLFVASTEGFPSATADNGNCFYIRIIRKCDKRVETMRVTLTLGGAWSVDRAVGFNETPLDFDACDIVQSTVLAPAVMNISACTIRTTDVDSLPLVGVCEGTRAMDTTNPIWVEYEYMNGSWNLTGRTFDSATNTFA